MQRENLTSLDMPLTKQRCIQVPERVTTGVLHGCRHASCREMLGSVQQQAQPLPIVATFSAEHSIGTAGDKPEEGGDDVRSSMALMAGLHT